MTTTAVHWDEYGKPRAKHPPCLICGADEIGSRFGDAWCHCCQWRGPLLALLAGTKERADVESELIKVTEERDQLSAALEQAARDGEEFHRMQAAINATRESGPWESPGIIGMHRELYVAAWHDVFDKLIDRLSSEGLMPS